MKITFKTEELASGVDKIQSALSARTTLPILLNFLLETDGAKAKLISTDLQMGIKQYIKSEIEKEGSITIPAKKFSEILNTLAPGQEIFLSVADENRVQIRCGRSRFIINGTPKTEYPVLPEFNKKNAFDVPRKDLCEMVKRTIFAASSDETRYVLNGVYFCGSNGALELAATDGRRLAVAKKNILPKEKQFRAIIPTKILHELVRILGADEADEERISLSITENQVAFQWKDTTMLSRLVEGSFPNYEQVIPAKKDIKLAFNTKDLVTITKQASLCVAERGGSVKFTLKNGALCVAAASQTMEFEDDLSVEYKGEDFVIAFNPQYVLEGLRAIGTERVCVGLTTPVNPALFEPAGEEGYKYVVMPMRT
jgi:DNA polymerase III subunit beta